MKQLLLTILTTTLLSCQGGGGSSAGRAPGPGNSEVAVDPIIYVVDESSDLSLDEIQLATANLQRQLDGEFYDAWGIRATLVIADPPSKDDWSCTFGRGGEDICDPVAPYGYEVGTKNTERPQVSDFTYPSYWEGGGKPWDWLEKL